MSEMSDWLMFIVSRTSSTVTLAKQLLTSSLKMEKKADLNNFHNKKADLKSILRKIIFQKYL
jgi:hypothetical protein